MHRFHDPFDIYAFRRRFTRTPDYAVAGHQRTDGTANIAAVNVAIGGFHISVHTKAADDDTFIRLAKQIVVVVGLLLRRFKTTLVIGVHAALLAFGEFIFTQSYRLWSPLMGKTSMIHAIVDQYSHCEWVENSMSANENNLIWIDLEMTGLDPERDRIIEIATLVTDANLNILAEGPTIAVHQSDEQLALMDDWNVRTHTASGLVERVKASTMGDREAELATLEFLKQWVPAGKSPICGNSIGRIVASCLNTCRSWKRTSTTVILMSAR